MNTETQSSLAGAGGGDAAWSGLCTAAQLAELVSDRVVVVDARLRIRLANKAFLAAFGGGELSAVCGRTLGEVVACRHADGDRTCGDTAACTRCGWFQAVQASAQGVGDEWECRILTRSGDALELAVSARPTADACQICSLRDLFAQKRLRVLERSFFHDVTNYAAGIRGLCEMIDDPVTGPAQAQELRPLIHDSANKLVDEIERLRMLRAAENGDLRPFCSEVLPDAILQAVAARFRDEAATRRLDVLVEKGSAAVDFVTDKELLALAFGDLVRNAIEASTRGCRVTLSSAVENGQMVFRVHNPAVLDDAARAHIFERSYTTKGLGKGVGAYRAKLIAERYLQGEVVVVSGDRTGTMFSMRLPLALKEQSD